MAHTNVRYVQAAFCLLPRKSRDLCVTDKVSARAMEWYTLT